MPEVRDQAGEVIAICGGSGKLPIQIETIENAGLTYARRERSTYVHVHAAFYESLAILGKRGTSECFGVRAPTANGHDDLQVRIKVLELLQLMKVTCEGAMAICLAVDGVRRRDRCLVVSIRVKTHASIVDDVGEGVIEMG